jgi:hypothetical protein
MEYVVLLTEKSVLVLLLARRSMTHEEGSVDQDKNCIFSVKLGCIRCARPWT